MTISTNFSLVVQAFSGMMIGLTYHSCKTFFCPRRISTRKSCVVLFSNGRCSWPTSEWSLVSVVLTLECHCSMQHLLGTNQPLKLVDLKLLHLLSSQAALWQDLWLLFLHFLLHVVVVSNHVRLSALLRCISLMSCISHFVCVVLLRHTALSGSS